MSSTVAATTVASIVGGEVRRDAPGGRLTSTNPARTDDVVAEVLLGDASTCVDAARAARAAQKEWAIEQIKQQNAAALEQQLEGKDEDDPDYKLAKRISENQLARLIDMLLKHGTTYVRQNMADYERQYHHRMVQNLTRRAKALGYALVKTPDRTPA